MQLEAMSRHIDFFAIADRLREANLPDAVRLAPLAERSWRMVLREVALDSIAIGQSRSGGVPDVPAGFVWPQRDGRPLSFVAQLDLRDVDAPSLPSSGWLLFFYDALLQPSGSSPTDADGIHVVHIDVTRDALSRRSHDVEDAVPFQACSVLFAAAIDLPAPHDHVVTQAGVELDYATAPRQYESYCAVAKALALRESTDGDETYHHLLGHPQPLQNDMRGQLAGTPSDWQLLLQLDSDEAPRWSWGIAGRIYFWIRRADLAARRFDKTCVVLQYT